MSFKAFLKTIVFLAILFVVLYIGMHNTQDIDFRFPLLFPKKVTASAALLYFAMFAIGVLAGSVLAAGSGGGGRKSSGAGKNPR